MRLLRRRPLRGRVVRPPAAAKSFSLLASSNSIPPYLRTTELTPSRQLTISELRPDPVTRVYRGSKWGRRVVTIRRPSRAKSDCPAPETAGAALTLTSLSGPCSVPPRGLQRPSTCLATSAVPKRLVYSRSKSPGPHGMFPPPPQTAHEGQSHPCLRPPLTHSPPVCSSPCCRAPSV